MLPKQFHTISLIILLQLMMGYLYAQPSVTLENAKEKLRSIIRQFPDSTEFVVRSVTVGGYKKTKEYIVLREVPFKQGSRIFTGQLEEMIEQGRVNVSNTQLFLEVIPSIQSWDERHVDIHYEVKERWYLFPFPYFKLVDRNLNQWLVEQERSLERVNYGLKLNWDNVSGRRDKLNFNFINGYTREYSIFYEQPYADKKLEKGFLASVYFKQSRQMVYATDSNKQVFFPVNNNQINEFVRTTFRAEAGYSIRKGVNHRHTFRLSYINESIPDTINRLIANNSLKGFLPYFNDNRTSQQFGEFTYTYQYYNANNIVYPWKGFIFSGAFTQRGLGIKGMNLWQFSGKAGKFFQLTKKTSASAVGYYLVKVPFKQPMYNMTALGYGDWFMRGLEYYVIDGVQAGIFKGTIRQEILNLNVPTFIIKNEKYKKIPFKIIAKVYGDIGASHLPAYTNSILNNRFLYTYGAGIDVLSYYDFIARFEYSFNQLGQKGLFLHVRRDF
nr:POTRA domain-containing protein [uncultured Lacibacter sp.]